MAITINAPAPVQVLALGAGTLVSASYSSSNATGLPYGRIKQPPKLVMVETIGKAATSVTAVKFQVYGSRTGAAGTWVPIKTKLVSTDTAAFEQSVAVTASTTTRDGIVIPEDAREWPYIDVQAKSVTADASGADAAAACMWR